MGTRSRIAMANADGTFTSIYCHWDGYPSHHGTILRDHYSDPAKVKKMISLGDMSSLGAEIGGKHDFDERADACTFYRRDRGEKGVGAKSSADFEQLCELTQETGGEYLYVFKAGQWFCSKGGMSAFGMPADKAPEFLEHIDQVLIQAAKREAA